ncbi:MAG: hypothetical protein OXE87_14550 [Chloroflexi bacterium]|nr:hypothetical protein [Chloroflexota bacterium]
MHNKFRLFRRSLLGLSLVAAFALIACTAPAAPETSDEPADTSATVPADSEPSSPQQAVPVADFVQQHAGISSEWDQFHGDFDQWSASLESCHPNAMREAVNEFAVSFNSVTEQARGLTRGKTSGEIADLLIVAAEEEETALRQLRDRWQPNNISLFENIEQHRTKASQAQKSAEDLVIELRDGFQDTADPEATAEFLEAFQPVKEQWNQLHDDYETLRDDADSLGAAAVREGIELHVTNLGTVIDGLEDLPELEAADEIVEELVTAAKAELEAFEAATASESAESDTATATESATGTDSSTSDSADQSGANGSTTTQASGSGGDGLPDFEALDMVTDENAKVLKSANRSIEDLADSDAEEGLAELQVFDTEYARLTRAWDAFHDRYNDWRKSDAGCDRAQVVQDLEEHSLQIAEISRDVRNLPSTGSLLPIYSLLTEAAARDEDAIRTLRYTWQPFAVDAFKAVHQERTNTESLRRQAEIAVQELANRS